MKCYLSGMPELRLGLNDKVMFESTGRGERFGSADVAQKLKSSGPRQIYRDGGCQVPPMCPAIPLRERPNYLVHSPRRRI